MFQTIRLCAAAMAAALLGAAAHAQPSVEAFARMPAIQHPVLSPDGTRFAYLENNEEGGFVVVRNVADFDIVGTVALEDVKTRDLTWAGDEFVILIFSRTERVPGYVGPIEFFVPAAIDTSDMSVVQLMSGRRTLSNRNRGLPMRLNTNRARIEGVDPGSGHLLIPELDDEYRLDLFAVDPKSDGRSVVEQGGPDTAGWVVDRNGEPAVRVDFVQQPDRENLLQFRTRGPDGFWPIRYQEETDIPETSPVGLDGDGRLVLAMRSEETGRFALYPMDMETGDIGEAMAADDTYDISAAVIDPETREVLGARIEGDEPETLWFDEDMARRQATFDASFGGASVAIVSWSRDRTQLILGVYSGETPTIYYHYDDTARNARAIQATYPKVLQAGAAPRLSMLYTARDGVQVPGYLTIGDDVDQPAPLVVLPHGGPEARDVGGFDWLAHFLASRGYAVLQPNFRGSEGYGMEWRDAGRGGWGTGVMQHDVSDGVDALIDAGVADPDRVCIVGASYGGYAALAGAVFTPELYACAAAIAPVSDLGAMIRHEESTRGLDSWVIDYWETVIGGELDPAGDRLAAMSPANFAADARAPVLLVHGRDDAVVPISQSRRMEDALEDADREVELVTLDGEDHWLSRPETRLALLQALEDFLGEHLDD